jgi:carbon monoxide dehydrogenase subunit G
LELKGEYRIAADRETVWAALNDPAVLQRCIPGCESLERVSDHEFAGRVTACIGPVRATFETNLKLADLDPPSSYTITGDSKAGAAGFGRGRAEVRLAPANPGTLLSYAADFKVGGKLAQAGSRLLLGATRKIADDFFGCFARQLDAGALSVAESDAAAPRRSFGTRSALALVAAAAVVLIVWFLLG